MTNENDQQDTLKGQTAEQGFLELSPEMLLALMYHETRTYLTIIDVSVSLALEIVLNRLTQIEPSDPIYTVLSSIKDLMRQTLPAMQDVQSTMENLHLAHRGIPFVTKREDIVTLIKSTVRDFMFSTGTSISVMVLPEDEPIWVRVDKLLTAHALLNLLTNAWKYGGKDVKITVSVEKQDTDVLISVQDSGPGIPQEKQGIIWGAFQRATSDSSKPGMGAGLYICREVVRKNNGSIDVISEPGKGSNFRIKLPLLLDKARQQ